MHETLKLALTKADEVLVNLTAGSTPPSVECARLEKLSKKELIQEILVLKAKKQKEIKVEDLVYAVMCTPECAPLSYGMIAAVVVKHRPGKTNDGNIRWYASKAIEKGYDVVPRMVQSELNKLLMSIVG